jgi:hypothetical protein
MMSRYEPGDRLYVISEVTVMEVYSDGEVRTERPDGTSFFFNDQSLLEHHITVEKR